jgi:hypothetical protein
MDKNYNEMRNAELNQMMEESNELPGRLDYIKTRTKARARGRRRAVFAGSFTGSIAALFLCFVLAINTSTAFAQTMHDIPALSKLVESVSWNNSFQKAYDNDYAQFIGQKSKSGNNELELAYVMEDKSHLIMVFRFTKLDESLKGKQLSIEDKYINDISTGEDITMGGHIPSGCYKENELISMSLILDESSFHSDLDAQIKLYKQEGSDTESRVVDTGERFNFKFHVKETVKEKVYALNKTIEIGQQKVCLESLVVYPTCSIATVKADSGNTELIKLIEVALIDDSGQELPMEERATVIHGYLAEQGYMKFFLSSDYYSSSESLTLLVKCAYMLPKDMVNVTIDLNKGVMTDSTGIVQDMKIKEIEDKGETINITLDCNKDFQVMGPTLGMDYRFSDGTEYQLQSGSSMIGDNGHFNEYLFDVKKPKDGIIKVDRRLAGYKADLNIKVPIR